MKIICLLLCLALAQGHIFRRQYNRRRENVIAEPLDYNNEAQREQDRVQEPSRPVMDRYMDESVQWANTKRYNPERVVPEYQTGPQSWQRKQKQQPQQIYQETREQYQVLPEYLSPMDSFSVDLYSPEHGVESKLPIRNRVEQRIDPMIYNLRQPKQSETKIPYEKVENSWEIPMMNEYARPMYADDAETMNTRMYQRQVEMKPNYGDAISWRGIQFAVNPKEAGKTLRENIAKIYSDAQKTMKHLSKERKGIFHKIVEENVEKVNEDAHLNATQLLSKYQYPVETHTAKTSDGYYLTLFRIPARDNTLVQKPVVFLMHGLLGSADDWLLMGPSKSLAYMLSDAGYDVWLGNARGNKYSRRHVSKYPAQPDFWQFSTDEIALYDLPAMIDYVLETTHQEKLHYVGFSQGTTAFFALAATRPEYNNKIIKMYALSPMAYMTEVRSPLFRAIAPTSPFYEQLHEQLGQGEFRPNNAVLHTIGYSMCMNEIGCKHVCSNVYFVMAGVNFDNVDVEKIPVIMGHLPAGGSTRQMKQYAQAYASREFNRYDYGPEINQQVYGSIQPPKYDMSKVETPVTLYYSEEDWLAQPRDVERLAQELPKAELFKVLNYNNMDFQFSRNVSQDVYERLINSIKQTTEQINV